MSSGMSCMSGFWLRLEELVTRFDRDHGSPTSPLIHLCRYQFKAHLKPSLLKYIEHVRRNIKPL
jgi:hypothetical protein